MWCLKIINMSNIKTLDDYNINIERQHPLYFKSLKEIEKKYSIKLYKYRCGYGGLLGNLDFVVTKI